MTYIASFPGSMREGEKWPGTYLLYVHAKRYCILSFGALIFMALYYLMYANFEGLDFTSPVCQPIRENTSEM